jgi:alkaline phosphatase
MIEGGAIDWACHSNDAATAIKDVIEMDEAIRVAYEFYLQHQDETLIVVTADHETGGMCMGNQKGGYTLNLQILQNQHTSLAELSNSIKDLHKQYGKKMTWEMVKDLLQKSLGFYDKVEITKEEDAALRAQFKAMKKGKSKDVKTLYKQLSSLSFNAVKLLNEKARVAWGATHHSASFVPVFAVGVGAEQFTGWQDNTTIVPKIMHAIGE